jgi:proline racemase
MAEQLRCFREVHDRFRSAVVNEPRGSDVLVGALIRPPNDPACVAGVIFFNNVGYLGMCGHGTIGVIVTLAHLGQIKPGEHRFETPVGVVKAVLHSTGEVTVFNVPSYRKAKAVSVELADGRKVTGDIAWGGNWFYLVGHDVDAAEDKTHPDGQLKELWPALTLSQVAKLTDVTWELRQAVNAQGFPEVDHVELFGRASLPAARSRNFVLCPGKAYDRSPCGTGTSAKLACLAADGKLGEGENWVQESILGSTFTGRFRWLDRARGEIAPEITGTAHVNAESTMLLDESDPFCWGITT